MSKPAVDPLLAALGRAAREEREQEQALERFEPLASEDLPESDRSRLEAEAAAAGLPDLAALLRPIDAGGQDRMASLAAAALRSARASNGHDEGAASEMKAEGAPDGAAHTKEAARGGVVIPFHPHAAGSAPANDAQPTPVRPRSVRRRAAAAVASLAIAAGVALFVATRPDTPALPGYEASLAGGVHTSRAPGDAPPLLAPGEPVRVRLRPERAVNGKVKAIAALAREGHHTPLAVTVQPFEAGALALQVTLPESAAAGAAEIVIVVAEEGDLPAAVPDQGIPDTPRRRVLRVPVVVGAP